eukprot:8378175-Alexandrium_andersonii.AAC.1
MDAADRRPSPLLLPRAAQAVSALGAKGNRTIAHATVRHATTAFQKAQVALPPNPPKAPLPEPLTDGHHKG